VIAMSPEPIAVHPSRDFSSEVSAFLEALEVTSPEALTMCAQ